MKRIIILFISLCALVCAIWYGWGRQTEKAENLFWAAYDGDLTGVKNALEDGAPPDWVLSITDETRQYHEAEFSVLAAAASGGNNQVLQYLLAQGLSPNTANSRGWTPLFIAIRDGHAETAAELVLAGAEVNAATDLDVTPLITALISPFEKEKDQLALLEFLLKREADANAKTRHGTDALFYAVTVLKNKTAVQLLIEYQADVCRLYNGKDILQLAEKHQAGTDIKKLLKKARSGCR